MDCLLIKKNNKLNIRTALVIVLTACVIICRLFFPVANPVFIFNYANFRISSPSMEPEYPVNSIVIIKKEPFTNLKTGDVIVYKSQALRGGLAFHRITRVTATGVFTKGDGNNYEDNQLITEETYIGKGVTHITFFADYLALIHTPPGFILFFLLPCSAAVLLYCSVKLLKNEN